MQEAFGDDWITRQTPAGMAAQAPDGRGKGEKRIGR
jgi:hypothetical protein